MPKEPIATDTNGEASFKIEPIDSGAVGSVRRRGVRRDWRRLIAAGAGVGCRVLARCALHAVFACRVRLQILTGHQGSASPWPTRAGASSTSSLTGSSTQLRVRAIARAKRERAKRERAKRERAEWERAKRERAKRERAKWERAKRERAEWERAKWERAKRERAEWERAEWERAK